jgi:DNA polymerase-3 subunit gamma/tau
MSYQVLARKWRPSQFDEIVGQDHVLRAMINALDRQRLHHAYLFTGTRGVGKTTLARILAKCLNCEEGVSSSPCGVCSACREISEGRFVDLIEVDAASRTRVDDTRELLDNVQYAPTQGRYKVYLVDEVHMLSMHSFNALLKTLEEPPPHVKFLLATTDPQKLPVTVLSRCLQFNLKRVPEDRIAGHLEKVLTAEGVGFEAAAIRHLAHAADGSLRDALSLLDQAIAFGNGAVNDAEIGQMLGSVSRQHLQLMLLAVAQGDALEVMRLVDALAEMAPDYDNVIAGLITLLHDLALAQHIPESLELRGVDVAEISEIARQMAPEDIQLNYEIAVRARRDLPLIPDQRNGLEMALLRMLAFRPVLAQPVIEAPQPGRAAEARKAATRPVAAPPPTPQPAPIPKPASTPAARPARTTETEPAPTPIPTPVAGGSSEARSWGEMLPHLGLTGMSKMFASHCTLQNVDNGVVLLALSQRHDTLKNDSVVQKLQNALSKYYNEEVKVKILLTAEDPDSPAAREKRDNEQRQLEAEASIASDPVVDELKESLGAEVVPGSIKPLS